MIRILFFLSAFPVCILSCLTSLFPATWLGLMGPSVGTVYEVPPVEITSPPIMMMTPTFTPEFIPSPVPSPTPGISAQFMPSPEPTGDEVEFGEGAYSVLEVTRAEVNLQVCGANVPDNDLYVWVWRTRSDGAQRIWRYIVTPEGELTLANYEDAGFGIVEPDITSDIRVERDGDCTWLYNLDGAGDVLPQTDYHTSAGLGDFAPQGQYRMDGSYGCYTETRGFGLCDVGRFVVASM